MHPALRIPEIVAHVFDHFTPALLFPNTPRRQATTDLAALARTCHAFKEPALDVLWRDLGTLSPLVRCVSASSRQLPYTHPVYSFIKPLAEDEWDVFRSYARRIRSVQYFQSQLDWESVATFLNPPTIPLFPNLRMLRCLDADITLSLLCLPFPSLLHLHLRFHDRRVAQYALESFSKHSPNVTELRITVTSVGGRTWTQKNNLMNICCWKNLRSVVCPGVAFDEDALIHLSHIPTLTTLDFRLNVTLSASDASLDFHNLQDLVLRSESLGLIARLLSQTRLPVLKDFEGTFQRRFSRRELSSFFTAFCARGSFRTVEILQLKQWEWEDFDSSEASVLDLEVLQPCMAFSRLRHFDLDIRCDVALTSSQVVTLASGWPELQVLAINESWGWNSAGGITPCGLLQLLKACGSLTMLALRFDTRGYTEVPTSRMFEDLKSELGLLYVLDSGLEAQSIVAITSFFRKLVTSTQYGIDLRVWGETQNRDFPGIDEDEERWGDVSDEVKDAVRWHFGFPGPVDPAMFLE